MSDYKHGAYGQINAVGSRAADVGRGAIVYVGTAPVNQAVGGTKNVNKPVVINNISQARKYFGYSDNWADYTLCEPMYVHLEQKGVSPVVFINVLDPAKHKGESVSATLKFDNGRAFIPGENITIDTLKLKRDFEHPAKIGYIKDKTNLATAFEKAFGKSGAAAKIGEREQLFYYAFNAVQGKVVDYLFVIDTKDHSYACLDKGASRADGVSIFYFSLKDGVDKNEITFIDKEKASDEKHNAYKTHDFTTPEDVTFSVYTCTPGLDADTYPTDLKLVKQEVIHIEQGGECQQYYTAGVDYATTYSVDRGGISLQAAAADVADSVAITYDTVDPSKVTKEEIIGATDSMGLNTGIFAIKSVYSATGYIPAYLAAPGWASDPDVHNAMYKVSQKVNKHWDAYIFADMPVVDADGAPISFATAALWKVNNGYNRENETVYFPLARGTDGKIYHLSVLAAANFQELMLADDGIPFKSASNTEIPVVENLYMGALDEGRVYDDEIINDYLNANGIASAAYIGGRWVIWGAHSADYNQESADNINVAETNRMMLYYVSNDFQARRSRDVDKPMTNNDLATIVSEEQTRLDALVKIGALTYGRAFVNSEADKLSDYMMGDFSFTFNVTTTPLAKSLTAIVNWTEDGFMTYFALD